MNELISNLVDKTAGMVPGVYTVEYESGKKGVEFNEEALRKFVELIVQECMNVVCDPSTTYLESMTDASAMYTARERIRKHFRS